MDELTSAGQASNVTVYVADVEVTDATPGVAGGVSATRFVTFGGATVATVTSGGMSPVWALLLGDGQGSAQVSMSLTLGGSVTGVVGASATDVVTRNAYEPFGSVRGSDNLEVSRGWLGQVSDADTGLVYLNARYYDPVLARFISPDPLMNPGDPVTLDPYRYADNNPVVFMDPSGLAPCSGLSAANEKKCLDAYHKGGAPKATPGTHTVPKKSTTGDGGPAAPKPNGDDSYRPTMDGRIYRDGQFDCVAGAYQCVQANIDAGPEAPGTPVTASCLNGALQYGASIFAGSAHWWFEQRPSWLTKATRAAPVLGGGLAALDSLWTGHRDPLYSGRSAAVGVLMLGGRAVFVGVATALGGMAGSAAGSALAGGATAAVGALFPPALAAAPVIVPVGAIVGDIAVSGAWNGAATAFYDDYMRVAIFGAPLVETEVAEMMWNTDMPFVSCRDQRQMGFAFCAGG